MPRQFRIRHLLLLTAVVASLLGMAAYGPLLAVAVSPGVMGAVFAVWWTGSYKTASTGILAAYYVVFILGCCGAILVPLTWEWVTPEARLGLTLALAGLCGVFGGCLAGILHAPADLGDNTESDHVPQRPGFEHLPRRLP
jgi:hypothetical protein